MLETLTQGFKSARDHLRGVTRLTEENVEEALREIRMSLLEADVDLQIVRGFLERVSERALGEQVSLKAGKKNSRVQVSAGDHFTKSCYDELVAEFSDLLSIMNSQTVNTSKVTSWANPASGRRKYLFGPNREEFRDNGSRE